jgi:hypothetical protein
LAAQLYCPEFDSIMAAEYATECMRPRSTPCPIRCYNRAPARG